MVVSKVRPNGVGRSWSGPSVWTSAPSSRMSTCAIAAGASGGAISAAVSCLRGGDQRRRAAAVDLLELGEADIGADADGGDRGVERRRDR